MNDLRLCEDVKKNLEAQGIKLTEDRFDELCESVLGCMSEILDKGDIVDISNFGSFWRKKGEKSSATFFKPTDVILERINTLK